MVNTVKSGMIVGIGCYTNMNLYSDGNGKDNVKHSYYYFATLSFRDIFPLKKQH